MSTPSAAAASPYVTCDYCGRRISEAGYADHDANCGISEGEVAELDRQLGITRIQTAAAGPDEDDETADDGTEDDEEPVIISGAVRTATITPGIRCSCGEERLSWEGLGEHHSETGHTGMWMEQTALAVEVDGAPARALRGLPSTPTEQPMWSDPQLDLGWVFALQERIDKDEIRIGGVPATKACVGKAVFGGVEIACPHRTMVRSVLVSECDLHKRHTETLEQLCLIHSVMSWGGNVSPVGHGPLFGDS